MPDSHSQLLYAIMQGTFCNGEYELKVCNFKCRAGPISPLQEFLPFYPLQFTWAAMDQRTAISEAPDTQPSQHCDSTGPAEPFHAVSVTGDSNEAPNSATTQESCGRSLGNWTVELLVLVVSVAALAAVAVMLRYYDSKNLTNGLSPSLQTPS